MNTDWLLVDTPEAARKAAAHLQQAEILGIDTEYDSFRYFREKLCVIQIYAPKTTYVIDAMAGLDLSFLARLLKSRSVLKILHAADNDIRLIKRDYGFEFSNIFDTHRAAMLLGFKELSLEKMIKEFLGIELKKSKKMQRSRWDHRPLAQEQLEYAVQDVTLLPALCQKQQAALKAARLENAAGEAFARIAAAAWQERSFNRRGYAKIKGYMAMSREQKELLKKLYLWRFEKAREIDCAVFMFLPDDTLAELVWKNSGPQDILPPEKYKRYGNDILRILEESAG
ncbi:MAG: ribonuclease D [Deltaproteobacteria bacterium]|jgi:ribonuclease D|nr:ribonuclease D [Syntrophaceae bacterium]